MHIKKGDHIRKRSFALFRTHKGAYTPCLTIQSINKITKYDRKSVSMDCIIIDELNDDEDILINGKYYYPDTELSTVVVITDEEYERLRDLWYNKLTLSEPKNRTIEETCFTTYTGERTEKKKFKTFTQVKHAYFQIINQQPDKTFVMYECPNCNTFHIGKEEETIS